jgi:cell shape-determining protein MreC
VAVGNQVGEVLPQVNTNDMRLELSEAEEPVFAGDRVVTSSGSVRFPAGVPVGEVLADAAPGSDVLNTQVRPYVEPATLRLVVVLAWPPDPITPLTPDTTTTIPNTTSTTVPGDGTTSTTLSGDG